MVVSCHCSGCSCWGGLLFIIRILSYNVRGLGGFEKRREIKRLVSYKKPFFLCLQETKLFTVDDLLIRAIWGTPSTGYSFQPSVGASGGLLTAWDASIVNVWSTTRFSHVLIIRGVVLQTNQEFVIANIYAPCDETIIMGSTAALCG